MMGRAATGLLPMVDEGASYNPERSGKGFPSTLEPAQLALPKAPLDFAATSRCVEKDLVILEISSRQQSIKGYGEASKKINYDQERMTAVER